MAQSFLYTMVAEDTPDRNQKMEPNNRIRTGPVRGPAQTPDRNQKIRTGPVCGPGPNCRVCKKAWSCSRRVCGFKMASILDHKDLDGK